MSSILESPELRYFVKLSPQVGILTKVGRRDIDLQYGLSHIIINYLDYEDLASLSQLNKTLFKGILVFPKLKFQLVSKKPNPYIKYKESFVFTLEEESFVLTHPEEDSQDDSSRNDTLEDSA